MSRAGRGSVPVQHLEADYEDDIAGEECLVMTGDFTGDGVPDILLSTRAMTRVCVYRNERGKRPNPPAPPGTEVNFTLY